MQYDLLLKNGRVIDPGQGIDGPMDVALAAGKVAEVARGIPAEAAAKTIDVAGKLVVPGLIDLHAHIYAGVAALAIEVDRDCLAKGTTTVVDAGTAGAYNFAGFRRFIANQCQARALAFLNISSIGLPVDDIVMAELAWMPLINVKAVVEVIETNRDLIKGIKVRLGKEVVWDNGIKPLHLALEAAGKADVPLMIHVGDTPVPLGEILDLMRPGDILTHAYTSFGGLEIAPDRSSFRVRPFQAKGTGTTLLDADGKLIPEARAARERGVLFDIGHGRGSFSYEVFQAAMEQGFPPDTISTDLHGGSIQGPVYDFPTLMSRFLDLGLTLTQIIEATTARPARILGLDNEIGTLRPGFVGDVTVLELQEGAFDYRDAAGQTIRGGYRFVPHLTIRAGQPVGDVW